MPSPLDPRAIEGQDPNLSAPARTGELERRLAALERMVPRTVPTLVTALPGTPYDRQEVYYLADAANGIVWHLRYRAAATGSYKWETVGAPAPLVGKNTAPGTITCTNQFQQYVYNNSTPVTLPLAGDYMVRCGVQLDSTTNAGVGLCYLAVVRSDGGAAMVGVNDMFIEWNFFGNHFIHRVCSWEDRVTALAAASTLTPTIATFNAGVGYAFAWVIVTATPVRVG